MTNGVKEIMDAITAMVDAEYDRLTKEIREAFKANGKLDVDIQGLIEERSRIEDRMMVMASAGDTANVLPRDFLRAIDVWPGKFRDE